MNGRIVIPVLMSLLMAAGLNAQEISTSPLEAEGLVDVRGAPVANVRSAVHVPVSFQAIPPEVNFIYLQCRLWLRSTSLSDEWPETRRRELPLTNGAYKGVVSFYVESSNDDITDERLASYSCSFRLCSLLDGGGTACVSPGTVSFPWSEPDPIFPFVPSVSEILEE